MSAEDYFPCDPWDEDYGDAHPTPEFICIDYDFIEHSTLMAHLFVTDKGKFWMAKSQCVVDCDNKRVQVPSRLTINYLRK